MRNIVAVVVLFILPLVSFAQEPVNKYRCMVQMTNYMGEGAYIAVSLIDPKGNYEKTIYVMGSDKKWYPDIKEWHKSLGKKNKDISAITGASVAGGDRGIMNLEIETAKINAGYKLRFETAVEDKEYYLNDLEIALTTEALGAKNDGTGYIRYVRFSAN